MESKQIQIPLEQIFMVFYAIFWGYVANAQARWKAFQLPLLFRRRQATCRVLLSFILLNICPFFFFAFVWWILVGKHCYLPISVDRAIFPMCNAVIPAFAAFGFYRLWLGIVELRPDWFYLRCHGDVPKEYRHVEPIYSTEFGDGGGCEPVIHLGSKTGGWNWLWGFVYISVAFVASWPDSTELNDIWQFILYPRWHICLALVALSVIGFPITLFVCACVSKSLRWAMKCVRGCLARWHK